MTKAGYDTRSIEYATLFQLQEFNAYSIGRRDDMHEVARHLPRSASDQLQLSFILGIYQRTSTW